MRISDWSSDVCSSDLAVLLARRAAGRRGVRWRPPNCLTSNCSCRSGFSTKPSHPFLSQPEATMHRTLPVLLLALVPALASAQATDASRALAQDAVIVDTHIDAPGMLMDGWMDLGKEAEGREFDYPKARAGGLDVAFMSIYTSP